MYCKEWEEREINARLTVEEVNPYHSAIGETPIVDQLVFSNDPIPKRCQVTDGRTCADVLQEFPNGTLLASFPKLDEQTRALFRVGKEFIPVLFIEPSCNGIVD